MGGGGGGEGGPYDSGWAFPAYWMLGVHKAAYDKPGTTVTVYYCHAEVI